MWCLDSGMKLNLGKITLVSFTRKTNIIAFTYALCFTHIARPQCAVLLNTKLYFHTRVDHIDAQGLQMSGLIYYVTSSVSTIDRLFIIYCALVRSKLQSASVAWNSVTSTDSSETERVQREFADYAIINFFLTLALINTMICYIYLRFVPGAVAHALVSY
jgi:hypothetical protein